MDTRSLLRRLVETESPSHEKVAVDRVGAIVAEEARKVGAQVEIIPNKETGDHVLARFPASPHGREAWGEGGILLLCHMDTVFPLAHFPKFPIVNRMERSSARAHSI